VIENKKRKKKKRGASFETCAAALDVGKTNAWDFFFQRTLQKPREGEKSFCFKVEINLPKLFYWNGNSAHLNKGTRANKEARNRQL